MQKSNTSKVRHLSSLNPDALWTEFEVGQYPKWSTACLLRSLDIPVLDALFVAPSTSPSVACEAAREFASLHSQERVLIRTDGGVESGDYIRGGNSPTIEQATDIIPSVIAKDRALVLTIPTNRFDNRLAVNLGLDGDGKFRIEVAGPGFDVSDLNRGLITPEVIAHVAGVDWFDFRKPSYPFCSIEYPDVDPQQRRKRRLRRTAQELLPRFGVTQASDDERSPVLWAKEWLERNGNTGLFEKPRPDLSFLDVCRLYETAFMIGIAYRTKSRWSHLSVSLSDLGDPHGVVYWDVVNPSRKFKS